MHTPSGKQPTRDPEAFHNPLHALLGRESSNVEQDELIVPSVQTAKHEVPPLRHEGPNIDRAPPHLDVTNSEREEIRARHLRGRVRTAGAPVKAGDVIGDDIPERRSPIRYGIATEVRVIRRNQGNSGAPRGYLPEASDHELRLAVHNVGLKLSHRPGNAPISRHSEANVRIGWEGRARQLYTQVAVLELVDELLHPVRRLARIAGRDHADLPAAVSYTHLTLPTIYSV